MPLLVAGLLLVGWGVAGLIDLANVPYGGYTTGPDQTVVRVRAGSPAASAGLEVGDRLVRVNGVSMEDAATIDRMPRPALGETRTLVVESGGTTRNIAITYAALPASDVTVRCVRFLVALACIAFGLLPYWKAPGRASLLLALTGLLWSCEFLPFPYVASYGLRQVVTTVEWSCIAFGFATFLHALTIFPATRTPTRRRPGPLVLYLPASAIALFFAWVFLVELATSGRMTMILGAATGMYVLVYLVLSLAVFVHRYASTSPSERTRLRLHLALAGVVVGLVPSIVAALGPLLAPSVALPGRRFYEFTTVLALAGLALAVMRTGPDETPLRMGL